MLKTTLSNLFGNPLTYLLIFLMGIALFAYLGGAGYWEKVDIPERPKPNPRIDTLKAEVDSLTEHYDSLKNDTSRITSVDSALMFLAE